ncbi:thialysine N-epsilon-acetyltransferase-like [Arctopsyche grandis]|uniref:thialysine N-epsilon-acetyltransferase-like n=1 Tax=Arctopsyche grandis TaxID=121162 RepID=UPI00406D9958
MADETLIRSAKRADMVAVMQMIQELADFEKMSDGPKINAATLENDCFVAQPPLFQCFVADLKCESKLIGYSIFFNTYSTWEGKSLMLEDIYVQPSHRKKGVGKKMLSAVAKFAVETGCCRLDLHVLKWNPAKEFYKSKGAIDLTETEDWMFYRFQKDAMKKLSLSSEMSK